MGEVADMILDGTLCEGCGVYLGPSRGYPGLCNSCRKADKEPSKMVACQECGKRVKSAGLADHARDKHGKPVPVITEPPFISGHEAGTACFGCERCWIKNPKYKG